MYVPSHPKGCHYRYEYVWQSKVGRSRVSGAVNSSAVDFGLSIGPSGLYKINHFYMLYLSAGPSPHTFREEDDVLIGVRGLMNDYYAKDIGKKVRAGYRQKQREGLVITPPFGYWKDKTMDGLRSSRRRLSG